MIPEECRSQITHPPSAKQAACASLKSRAKLHPTISQGIRACLLTNAETTGNTPFGGDTNVPFLKKLRQSAKRRKEQNAQPPAANRRNQARGAPRSQTLGQPSGLNRPPNRPPDSSSNRPSGQSTPQSGRNGASQPSQQTGLPQSGDTNQPVGLLRRWSDKSKQKIRHSVRENQQYLNPVFANLSDVVQRKISISGTMECLAVYLDGLVNVQLLDNVIIKSLLNTKTTGRKSVKDRVLDACRAAGKTITTTDRPVAVDAVLDAKLVLFVDGLNEAFIVEMKAWASRSIEEPASETVIRGPREGFVETLRTNTSILRRKLKSRDFKMERIVIGQLSKTEVVLCYIEGIVNPDVLREVRERVSRIQIDAVVSSHYIEEFIEDSPYSPYPQVQNTERPDVVVAAVTEGKVAILMDGDPFALIVPMTFWSGFQAAEDYYERFLYASAIRWLRFILLNMSIFLTPLYVALTTYEPQMLPTNLILSFAAAREPSPFPTVVEAFLMEFVFEGLREAGVRLPKAVGSAVSIVGALVLGQAAVDAGLVDAPIVIMVALGGIASFATPRYNFGISYRLLRFPVLFLAGVFGLLGIAFAFLAILIHQVNLRSFGTPYMTPVAPIVLPSIQDAMARIPRWGLNKRPILTAGRNRTRVPAGQKPGPRK